MTMSNLYRKTCLCKDTLKAEVYDLSVCLWRYLYVKAELPQESGPEGKIIMEEEDIGNTYLNLTPLREAVDDSCGTAVRICLVLQLIHFSLFNLSRYLKMFLPQHFIPERKEVRIMVANQCFLFLLHIIFFASAAIKEKAFFARNLYPVYLTYIRTALAFKR